MSALTVTTSFRTTTSLVALGATEESVIAVYRAVLDAAKDIVADVCNHVRTAASTSVRVVKPTASTAKRNLVPTVKLKIGALRAMKNFKRIQRTISNQVPTLQFSPWAWAKLLFLRDLGPTEIGGFGISAERDLLLIEDIVLVAQQCSPASVAFDDAAVADFFDAQIDKGIKILLDSLGFGFTRIQAAVPSRVLLTKRRSKPYFANPTGP